MSHLPEPLSAEALRWKFSREEIAPSEGEAPSTTKFIGQERAERALEYGLSMRSPDFNVYIAGPPGTGKSTLCRSACERLACDRPVPADIVFVNNFDDPDRPVWLSFPPGLGKVFHEDMKALIAELRDSIPKAFEDEAQEGRRKEVIEEAQTRQKALFDNLESLAKEAGFGIRATQAGFGLHPLIEGEPATEETFEKLTEGERKQIDEDRAAFADHSNEFVKETRVLEKEIREKLHELDKDIAFTVVNVPVNDLREKYKDYENVLQHLDKAQGHILGNLSIFRGQDEGKAAPPSQLQRPPEEESFRAYEVNAVVNNAGLSCAPVVVETNPNFSNLFGRIERKAHFGTYTTDFTMIRAGSLIAANGGFLILNALDVLTNPGVWPALKRALRTRCVRIEDLGEMYGWSTGGLKPTPVPVDVKVILMGSPMIYYLLLRHDEEFSKHFKVKSDFGSLIDRTPESMRDFLGFIKFHREQSDLLPFDDGAVERILRDSARAVAHKEKMSARFSEMRELLLEADHWAREKGGSAVREEHVVHALEERRFRSNLIDERLRELITEGTVMSDTAGAVVGQVNGLAVLDLGGLQLRQALAHHRPDVHGGKGRRQHRAREQALGKHSRQGDAHPPGIPRRHLRPEAPPRPVGEHLLRAKLLGGGRGQRLLHRALRHHEQPRRASHQAGLRRHGLGQSAGGDPAHRRGEREDRGLLRGVQGDGCAERGGGRPHPPPERQEPHPARRGDRGG